MCLNITRTDFAIEGTRREAGVAYLLLVPSALYMSLEDVQGATDNPTTCAYVHVMFECTCHAWAQTRTEERLTNFAIGVWHMCTSEIYKARTGGDK